MRRHPEHIPLWALVLLVLLVFLLAGCHASRAITIKTTPATSVNTRVDSSLVRAPTLASLPRAGVRLSYPEAVRRYRKRLHSDPSTEVVEIVLGLERMTVRTRTAETVHRLPAPGEVKTLRPDSIGFREYVEGEPEAEERVMLLPREETVFERTVVVLKWLVVLVIVVGLVVGALRWLG